MTARGITLTRSVESIEAIPNRGDGFRIQIVASDGELMPDEIFLFKENLFDPITLVTGEEFIAITSPEDLVCYPVDAPVINSLPPFYRKSTIDVIVGSRSVAISMWEAVNTRVCELVNALNRKDRLIEEESVRCGEPAESTSESSVSVSVSISE